MIKTIGLALTALAASGWIATASAQPAPSATPAAPAPDTSTPADTSAPAPAKTPTHVKKSTHHATSTHPSKEAGDSAVEDLNAQSLDAAKSGKSFTPPTTTVKPPAPGKAKAKAKAVHHHHVAKKAAPPADSAPK